MTKRDFISVFLKIVGISLICIIPILFPTRLFDLMLLGIFILILLGVGLLLILLANKIATKLVPNDKKLKVINANIIPKDIFVIVMRIIWMFSIIAAIEHFISVLLNIERFKVELLISNVIAIIIGIYFLFGAKHVVKLLFDRKPSQPDQAINLEGSIT
ncbi:MAG TPA: hypothetical protein VJC37_06915 [Planctomycetota bacterium]|nr:hypothetical protein [Planctomycetota bacterium]